MLDLLGRYAKWLPYLKRVATIKESHAKEWAQAEAQVKAVMATWEAAMADGKLTSLEVAKVTAAACHGVGNAIELGISVAEDK